MEIYNNFPSKALENLNNETASISKSLTKIKLLENLLKEKDYRIKELESKVDSKAHLSFYNSLFTFINSELLTVYALIKGIYFYYMKGAVAFF